ncbi:MAG TPA: enoyl-CoA hydratase-related protein [Acidimicrobiia bacterium]|nr:enoyl-CoA hydratase-related protein [Acidimicrobiia bacterium]
MSDRLVVVEIGPVTTLRLDNPPMNLVTVDLTRQLDAALERIEGEEAVRAVVVTGTGERAFCAGSDIKEFEALAGRVGECKLEFENEVYDRLADLPVPTVAAIQADALGGGLELALCCDIRVADERARLGLPEVRLGVIPGAGGTQRLPRIVGEGRAKDLILRGRLIDTAEAERIGLVSRVAAAGEALPTALAVAGEIAERGPLAVRAAKQLIELAGDVSLTEGLVAQMEASEQVFASQDMLEGARAFLEKRSPRFTGR